MRILPFWRAVPWSLHLFLGQPTAVSTYFENWLLQRLASVQNWPKPGKSAARIINITTTLNQAPSKREAVQATPLEVNVIYVVNNLACPLTDVIKIERTAVQWIYYIPRVLHMDLKKSLMNTLCGLMLAREQIN